MVYVLHHNLNLVLQIAQEIAVVIGELVVLHVVMENKRILYQDHNSALVLIVHIDMIQRKIVK
jgi:hypothetical protein